MDKLGNPKNEIIVPKPEIILSSSEIKNFEPMDLVSVSGEKLTNFKKETRQVLESANMNIGLSAEKIDEIQKESGIVEELKAIEDEAEKVVQEKSVNTKAEENKEEELPYSKDFIKNIQNLYFQEQSRLEDLGVSGQTLQVRLGEYKKRILEPMLEKESEENETKNSDKTNSVEKKEEQLAVNKTPVDSREEVASDANENTGGEIVEKKVNNMEGAIKEVPYEEWKKTLNPKLLPNAKEYENLRPTYFVDDKNNHFVAFNEGGKKIVDKLYLNENNRVYVMPVDPLSIENK